MSYVSIVDTYLDELKRRLSVSSDELLAKRLNIGKSTLATWRRRGAIPEDAYRDLHPDPIDYFALVHRHLALVLATSEVGLKVLLQAAMRLAPGDDRDAAGWADWLISNRELIFEHIVRMDDVNRTDERIADDYINRRLMGLALTAGASGILAPDMLRKLRQETTA